MANDINKYLSLNGLPINLFGIGCVIDTFGTVISIKRYEKTLFRSSNGLGVATGTFSEPLSDFDEIGIACGWNSSRNVHGRNWLWFSKNAFQSTTGTVKLSFTLNNSSNYYFFMSLFNYDNENKTFTVPNDQATHYWGLISPVSTTGTIVAQNNNSRHQVICEIVGVKYQ